VEVMVLSLVQDQRLAIWMKIKIKKYDSSIGKVDINYVPDTTARNPPKPEDIVTVF